MLANTSSPFKFLDSFTRADREIFFGREKEIEELYARVFQSNMLLVYGASGTGKTSLIQCGLANKFNESDWMPILVRRGENMSRSLADAIRKQAITPIKENARLKKCIESLYLDHFKPIYLLFDQFEELFIFGSKDEIDHFIDELKAVIQAGLSCKFIFIIRGEYLENLSQFEEQIPEFFQNRIRIEKMTRTTAQEAILGPCRVFNIPVEEGFAQSLLDKISPDRSEVELTYLQVFLDKLYKLAVKRNPNEIAFRNSMLQELGNISDVLADFLEEQLATIPEANKAVSVLKSFVSTEGTKRQLSLQEAGDFTRTLGQNLTDKEIEYFANLFVNLRILRDKDEKDKYELRHDSLAAKIFEKITLTEKELLQVRQLVTNRHHEYQVRGLLLNQDDLNYIAIYEKQLFLDEELNAFLSKSRSILSANRRLKRRVSLVSLLSLMLLVAAVAFYFFQKNQLTRANELAAMSLIKVDEDPTLAYLLAEKAYELNPDGELIRKALINAYRGGPYYYTLEGKSYVLDANGKKLVTAGNDSTLRFYDLTAEGAVISNIVHYPLPLEIFSVPANGFTTDILSKQKDFFTYSENSEMIQLWSFNGVEKASRRVHDLFYIKPINGKYLFIERDRIYLTDQSLATLFTAPNPEAANVTEAVQTDDGAYRIAFGFFQASGSRIETFSESGNSIGEFTIKGFVYQTLIAKKLDRIIAGYLKNDSLRTKGISIFNRDGKVLQFIPGYSDNLVLSADESEFLSNNDTSVALFDLDGKRKLLIYGDFKNAKAIFSKDGREIYISSGKEYTDIYLRTGKFLQRLKGDLVQISADGHYRLAVDDIERSVELYSSNSTHFSLKRKDATFADERVIITPDNQYVITGSLNGNNISIWHPHYFDRLLEVKKMIELDDKSMLLQRSNGLTEIIEPSFHSEPSQRTMQFAPELQVAISARKTIMLLIDNNNESGKIRLELVDRKSGKSLMKRYQETNTWAKKSAENYQESFSFDDKLFGQLNMQDSSPIQSFGPAEGDFIELWSLQGNLKRVQRIDTNNLHGTPKSIAFSKATPFFVIRSDTNVAWVWRYDTLNLTCKPFSTLNGHKQRINSAHFSPDGKFIITASNDSTIRIWDLGGNEIHLLNKDVEDKPVIMMAMHNAEFSYNTNYIVFSNINTKGNLVQNIWMNIPYGFWLSMDAAGNILNKPEITAPSHISIQGDGRLVCTTEEDFVRLRTFDGDEIFSVNGREGNFTRDGKYLLIATDNEVEKVPVEADEIIRLVRKQKVYGELRPFTPRELEEYGIE